MKQADNRLRTLQVLGQPVYYLALPEGNLILIRPLCEVLGVEADNQLEKLKNDEIFGDERAEHPVHLPGDDKRRKWICLPERFIYGWIVSIPFTNTMKSETKAQLVKYKRECYEVLFNHFHGKIKEVQELEKAEAVLDLEIDKVKTKIKNKLATDPDQLRLNELEDKKQQVKKAKNKNRLESRQIALEFALRVVEPEEQEA